MKTQTKKIGKMDNRIKRLVKKNDEIYDQNENITSKLEIIAFKNMVSKSWTPDKMITILSDTVVIYV